MTRSALAVRRRSFGSAFATQLLLVATIGLAAVAGLGHLGTSVAGAIDGQASGTVRASITAGAPHEGSLVPTAAVSDEAGLFHAARAAAEMASIADEGADFVRPGLRTRIMNRIRPFTDIVEVAIRRITHDDPPRPTMLVTERRYMPSQVRKLRDAAHRLWVEDLTEGAVPSGLVRDPVTGFTEVRFGKSRASALVGPVPRFTDPEAYRLLTAEPEWVRLFGDKLSAQLQGMLQRLDDAHEHAFARGFTGTNGTGRTHFLGPDIARFQGNVNNAFVPPSSWFVIVHGAPDGFMRPTVRGGVEAVSLDEMLQTLKADGFREGQPILLASCSAGACFTRPESAAQQLANATRSPVVAASNTVWGPESGGLLVHGQYEGQLGEWRLFQPHSVKMLPPHKRFVVGRDAFAEEFGVASVNDLWRVRPGTAERVELAGPWERYLADNEGAFDAAMHALKPGGRLVIRVEPIAVENFLRPLQRRGFLVKRSLVKGHVTIIATKPV